MTAASGAAGVCAVCYQPMVVYERGQTTHPNCDSTPPPENASMAHTDRPRPTRDSTHECPGTNCGRRVGRTQLACPRHWAMVDAATQRRVYAAYRSGDVEAHHEAMVDAIQDIHDVQRAGKPGTR